MPIYYLDYVDGNDTNDGSDWANAWKTITLGATAARIAPGDIIRIAKSPAPASIGNGTWTNLSKTVTLASAGTAVIDLCETEWTGAGDTTITRYATSIGGKEGSYFMNLAVDAAPQASILQAYFATGELNLSTYQKISFWIRNSGAIIEDNWIVNLCSDVAGADVVDSFLIPAIPSINRWISLTLTKEGGGNLGASIKSIAFYSGGTTTGMASKFIRVDDFIACTTDGLNLQSLISKNSAEQGGTEGWYVIQSINDVTVLLDNDTETKGDAGRGYSTTGTSPETVTTYKRETIKTEMESAASNVVQQVMDNGTLADGNIEFQGGYNIDDTEQDGETFFDGLNGFGHGIRLIAKRFVTLNYLNTVRYYNGFDLQSSYHFSIINLSNSNNNSFYGVNLYSCYNVNITNLGNANNNLEYGVNISNTSRNINITTLSSASNNLDHGINCTTSYKDINITTLSSASNNVGYGIYYGTCNHNSIKSLSTIGNTSGGIYIQYGTLYLSHASIAEGTEIGGFTEFHDVKVYSNNHDKGINHRIFTDGGQIDSEATDREGGTGIMWKLAVTSANRSVYYPLKLSIAKIAVVADKLVTVNAYMKKSHATNVEAMLVCSGGQLTGMTLADITDTKADDADTWEELEITFTPTQVGVVEIEAWTYYVAANADVYVEDMTISQAD